jgi:hypothetical protein
MANFEPGAELPSAAQAEARAFLDIAAEVEAALARLAARGAAPEA